MTYDPKNRPQFADGMSLCESSVLKKDDDRPRASPLLLSSESAFDQTSNGKPGIGSSPKSFTESQPSYKVAEGTQDIQS